MSLRLWTLQRPCIADALAERGQVFAADPEDPSDRSDSGAPAHRWIAAQLAHRLKATEIRVPFWAWDMRRCPRLNQLHVANSSLIRIELEAPRELVLLSQFHLWEHALCGAYIAADKDDEDRLEGLDERGELTEEIVNGTWARALDLEFGAEAHWGPARSRWIQACLPYLDQSWVVSIRRVHQIRLGGTVRSMALSWTTAHRCENARK
ncbi:MAG: DUF3841 domain-containing protein [Phycisphaerales bacterium JB039]